MDEVKICRFCLNNKSDTEFWDIFVNVPSDFISKIENCVSIQVSRNDGLPKFVCLNCLQKINSFDTFKKICCDSNRHLIELRGNACKLSENVDLNKIDSNIFQTMEIQENNIESDSDNDTVEYEMDAISESYKKTNRKINFDSIDDSIIEIIGNNVYVCDICGSVFDGFIEYYDHQMTHDGNWVFKCDKCNEIFNERRLIVEHDNKHKVSCTICKVEILPKSLQAHLLIHTDVHKCSICNMRHTSKASLEKHIQARHTGVKGFVCHICGKQNSCQSSMNRHMAYHSNERPYKCKYCDFSAKSLNIVQVHTSRKHFAEKCVCEICAKIFKSQPSLIQHMKRIHSNKRHVCGICNKEFIERYNLSKHMKKHVGQRLHECKICQREFFTVRKLKEHMHTHRQGCVSCTNCGKEFFYKKYFSKHILKCNGNEQVKS